MAYLYETHLHTCQGSACGTSTGREHARYYKEIGYQGIIVTDHFFGGNTAVPRNLPWKQRIELFCSGYEDALAEGQRIGLDVFFGWEQGYGDDEYLIYGLDKQWLLNHPEVEFWTRREQLEGVHKADGCVVQAHPFRMRSYYMRYIRLGLRYCDGIEAANGGNTHLQDAAAYRYGQEFQLPMTAGSDNHLSAPGKWENGEIYGIRLEEKLSSIHDLVRIIRQKQPIGLIHPQGRFDVLPDDPEPQVHWLDENEQLVAAERSWLHRA